MKTSTNIPTYILRKETELDEERNFLLKTETILKENNTKIIEILQSYGMGVDKIKLCIGRQNKHSPISYTAAEIDLETSMDSIVAKAVYREIESLGIPISEITKSTSFMKVIYYKGD